MELARAWFRNATPECPSELRALFESVEALRGIELIEATPEHVTRLPKRGEGRNHDLHVRCLLNGAPLTVCIEGKADETFGRTIADEISRARRRKTKTQTGLPDRVADLVRLAMRETVDPESEPWASMRYQLLTGLVGTALQAHADGSPAAAFVIHEFRTSATNDGLQRANDADLASFLTLVAPGSASLILGRLWGPVVVAGIQVFVGKVQSTIHDKAE